MNRFILCQGDRDLLGGLPLSMWVTLLARAITSHLEDWTVIVEPTISAVLYRPDLQPLSLRCSKDINSIIAEVATIPTGHSAPRAIQFLILRPADDAVLLAFLGGVREYFHVVTPLTPFSGRFSEPTFSVTSWLQAKRGKTMPAILLPLDPTGHAGPVSFYAIDDGWNAPNPPERDACRMRVNPKGISIAMLEPNWRKVEHTIRTPFERWARTITGRRVGVSISGGGAAVMRLVPLFRAFENAGVPLDLLSGASGSTAFSACYAIGGLPQVLALAERGLRILITSTLTSFLTSAVVQRYIDNFLMGCGVCNTEIRVVPMATALAPNSPPRPSVVVDGTFGEAARASGCMPFIGPYAVDGVRHVDGSIIAGLPPPFVTKQFGADVVFAMNVLAVPANRYPGEDNPLLSGAMGFLYHHSLLGRVVDTISAVSTIVHTISEGHGRDADIFIDAPPRNFSLFEPVMLFNCPKYADAGLGPEIDVDAIAEDCLARWRALP